MGQLRFSKVDLYKTFTRPFQLKSSSFIKAHFGWKGLVKVTFKPPFLNLKCPISNTFKLFKVLFCVVQTPAHRKGA